MQPAEGAHAASRGHQRTHNSHQSDSHRKVDSQTATVK